MNLPRCCRRLVYDNGRNAIAVGKTAASFLEVMLEPMYTGGANIVPESEIKEKKRRKKKSQGQQISR
jgi:hypothetical protein